MKLSLGQGVRLGLGLAVCALALAGCETSGVFKKRTDLVVAPANCSAKRFDIYFADGQASLTDAARQAIRDQVKAVELAAERSLLTELESLAPSPSGAKKPIIDLLATTARLWARVVPRPALTVLAERLAAATSEPATPRL